MRLLTAYKEEEDKENKRHIYKTEQIHISLAAAIKRGRAVVVAEVVMEVGVKPLVLQRILVKLLKHYGKQPQ